MEEDRSENRLSVREYLELIWLSIVVKKRNLFEYLKVICRYYGNSAFRKVDMALLARYLFKSPYVISKEFLLKKGEENIYAYGETPLTTLEVIVRECGILSKDMVFELGSGRGRGCFWLNTVIGCGVVGIEYIPNFVNIAQHLVDRYKLKRVEFRLEDILEADYQGATVLYLYGTCYESAFIKKLLKRFAELPQGTKVITVSYPLTDFASKQEYEVMKRFPAQFTWGEADVYLQVKL